jgi:hypothetical protein
MQQTLSTVNAGQPVVVMLQAMTYEQRKVFAAQQQIEFEKRIR